MNPSKKSLQQMVLSSGVVVTLSTALASSASAATFADTYVCRPTNAETSLESAVRLFRSTDPTRNILLVEGSELGRVKINQTAFGLEAVGSVVNIADATMDYKLIVPQVALNQTLDPFQVDGMVLRSLVGTFHPPTYVHHGPVQYLTFEPVACEATSSQASKR
jgi:hypothetical protein